MPRGALLSSTRAWLGCCFSIWPGQGSLRQIDIAGASLQPLAPGRSIPTAMCSLTCVAVANGTPQSFPPPLTPHDFVRCLSNFIFTLLSYSMMRIRLLAVSEHPCFNIHQSGCVGSLQVMISVEFSFNTKSLEYLAFETLFIDGSQKCLWFVPADTCNSTDSTCGREEHYNKIAYIMDRRRRTRMQSLPASP